jgi:superfamily II DNA or RNA helicase
MTVDRTNELPSTAGDRSRVAALSLARLTDRMTFSRATDYVDTGAVIEVALHENPFRISGRVQGTNRAPYTCAATVVQGASGLVTSLNGVCSCPVVTNCKHVFAMAITAFRQMRTLQATSDRHLALAASNGRLLLRPEAVPAPPAAWQRSMADLLTDEPVDQDDPGEPLGLQVELLPATQVNGRRLGTGPVPAVRVGLRPVVRGRKGGWIRTGVSWDKIGAQHLRQLGPRADHVRLLREINLLHSLSITARYFSYDINYLYLDGIGSRRIWDLLAEARSAGIEIVQSGRGQPAVTLSDGRAEIVLEADRAAGDLVMRPTVALDGQPVGPVEFAILGDPVHGIAYWPSSGDINSSGLTLVPSSQPVSAELRQFLAGGAVLIPRQDEQKFVQDFLPRLARRVPVLSATSVITVPEKHPPTLSLTVTGLPGHRAGLAWEWRYRFGDTSTAVPLWSSGADPVSRDREAEHVALQALSLTAKEAAQLTGPSRLGRQLAARMTLDGLAAVEFFSTTLPRLRELPQLTVTVINELSFRAAEQAPVISLSHSAGDDRDWFNLGITVTIDDEEVPFDELFKALAAAEEFMILPSGTYFALAAGPFEQLRQLIEEARGIEDVPGRTLKLSRFQASLWNELTDIGVVTEQAAAWQNSVGGLLAGDEVIERAVPMTLRATLRPYQQDGFNWLAFLYDHGLGGVLADDMGLGKTVQTLALICHARLERPGAAPFLVVAPTSVVGNWAAECAKFAPGLRIVAVTETAARGGMDLPKVVRGADIVVTSYALFRLDFAKYSALAWSGLILDEAQVVKNHQSKAFQCAIKLSTPFKLAITGTPMENNLLELWSIFAVTAPGLFPQSARFREYYQTPIERSGDSDRLAQLRRRIRPLMLRRTKEEVAKDLPPKQEQVIELEMNAQHRKVYETHLQRERQKVLGLIDDMSKNRLEIFRSLTLLRQLSLDASLVDEQYAMVPSTKLDALMDQVGDVVAEGHRTLIFSQFTGFLGKVRQRMDAAGIEYCYLDGTTRNRPAVIAEFKSGTAPVFLISLKAGGVGLNLTEADYCILLDPWWNPQAENQAIDRIHRIGQQKNVMVYRLVAKDTIEDKVMALKATKAKLFSSIMDSGTAQATALTAADIRELLS